MPRLRASEPPQWPEHLRVYDPAEWPSEYEFLRARMDVAAECGFKKLDMIRAMVALTGYRENR